MSRIGSGDPDGSQGFLIATITCMDTDHGSNTGPGWEVTLNNCTRVLVSATGGGWQNTDMQFVQADRGGVVGRDNDHWGRGPGRFEGADVTLCMSDLGAGTNTWKVTPLDGSGRQLRQRASGGDMDTSSDRVPDL